MIELKDPLNPNKKKKITPTLLSPGKPVNLYPEKKRVVIYARVSTEEQALKGSSIEDQVQRLKSFALLHDMEIIDIIREEGQSGKSMERPGIKRATELLDTQQADGIAVAKIDRLTRNVRDLIEFVDKYSDEKGYFIQSLSEYIDTSSAMGRMFLNLMGMFAQWERETIVERVKIGMAAKRLRGEVVGSPIRGCKRGGPRNQFHVQDEDYIEIIKKIKDMRRKDMTLREIGKELINQGLYPKKGNTERWSPQQILRLSKVHLNLVYDVSLTDETSSDET